MGNPRLAGVPLPDIDTDALGQIITLILSFGSSILRTGTQTLGTLLAPINDITNLFGIRLPIFNAITHSGPNF